MEKRCEDLASTLKQSTANLQEKIALVDSEKFKAMEKVTTSEMESTILKRQVDDLSIKATKMEVGHQEEVLGLTNRATIAEEEVERLNTELTTLDAKVEVDTTIIISLRGAVGALH